MEIQSRRLLKPPKNIEEEAMENFMEDTPLWVAYKKCRGTLSKLRNMEKFIGMMNKYAGWEITAPPLTVSPRLQVRLSLPVSFHHCAVWLSPSEFPAGIFRSAATVSELR